MEEDDTSRQLGETLSGTEEASLPLNAQVALFPRKSGVYLMQDADRRVIYIGKANDLRARVKSYFGKNNSLKEAMLMKRVAHIEYIVVPSGYEALLLENNLIKRYKPKYNVLLKDDKSFPVIKVSREEYPRVTKTRTILRDGSTYYGPFVRVGLLSVYLDFIEKMYPLRKCAKMKARSAPCMYYHIGRCAAVCAQKTSKEEYAKRIRAIRSLLDGRTKKMEKDLIISMHDCSKRLAFEEAKKYRDALAALDHIRDAHFLVHDENATRTFSHYLGCATQGKRGCIVLMKLQGGKVIDVLMVQTYALDGMTELLERFLMDHYAKEDNVSQHLVIPAKITEKLQQVLKKERGITCRLPKRDSEADLIRFANDNARQSLWRRAKEGNSSESVMILKETLALPVFPSRIEGFDVAHFAGKHTVASLVCFINGEAKKSEYRHFGITRLKPGEVDDYAALQEAVERRYLRRKREGLPLPDLIVVDGGVGQTNSVQKTLDALDLAIPLVGIAKKHEEIWFPISQNAKNLWAQKEREPSLRLPRDHEASRLLQAVRDEAHRFGTKARARKHTRELKISSYNLVAGIGERRAKRIAREIGSSEDVLRISLDELCKRTSLPRSIAKRLRKALREC